MKYKPMPSLLTSRGSRIGLAVACALFGVFQLAYAHASGHSVRYVVTGLFWIANGVFWGIQVLPRKKS
jgi:uncharacterized membrane protein HdeD (DUF308 family)